jgi:hypothetical protein
MGIGSTKLIIEMPQIKDSPKYQTVGGKSGGFRAYVMKAQAWHSLWT